MGGAVSRLLTFNAYCPDIRDVVSIPFYDCVVIHWEEKSIQWYCPGCKGNHLMTEAELKARTTQKTAVPIATGPVPPPWMKKT